MENTSEGTNGRDEQLTGQLELLANMARNRHLNLASAWLEKQIAARHRLIGSADDFEVVHHPHA